MREFDRDRILYDPFVYVDAVLLKEPPFMVEAVICMGVGKTFGGIDGVLMISTNGCWIVVSLLSLGPGSR